MALNLVGFYFIMLNKRKNKSRTFFCFLKSTFGHDIKNFNITCITACMDKEEYF